MPSFRNSIDDPLVPCVGFLRMQVCDSQVLLPGGPGRGQFLESGRTLEDLGTHADATSKGPVWGGGRQWSPKTLTSGESSWPLGPTPPAPQLQVSLCLESTPVLPPMFHLDPH